MAKIVASIIVLTTLSGGMSGQDSQRARDDQAVYAAALNHTIRPEVSRLFKSRVGLTTPMLLVMDRTVALCRPPRAPEVPCVQPEDLKVLEQGASRRGQGLFEALLTEGIRSELAAAFMVANAESHPMPRLEIPDVGLLASQQIRSEAARLQTGQSRGYGGLSRPAYATDGHALVYGYYYCGALCAYGWLFLLERRESTWQVLAAHLLWIS